MHIETTNTNGEDFARKLVTMRATEDGNCVTWSLPERLLRSSASPVIVSELVAEFRERFTEREVIGE